MKNILAFLMVLFFAACGSKEQSSVQTIDLADIPVRQVEFEVLPLDPSKILYPQYKKRPEQGDLSGRRKVYF